MRPLRPTGPASPASGVLRGLRAGVLAVLCVLLPLTGHVLSRCHAPRWVVAAAIAAVAAPGAILLTRRRLTDTQAVAVLAAAQFAAHLAYAPAGGASPALAGQGSPASVLTGWPAEPGTAGRPPTGVLVAGHLVAVAIAFRLLGLTERSLWSGGQLTDLVRGLLQCVRPVRRFHSDAPRLAVRAGVRALRSAGTARLPEGRAPPRRAGAPSAPAGCLLPS